MLPIRCWKQGQLAVKFACDGGRPNEVVTCCPWYLDGTVLVSCLVRLHYNGTIGMVWKRFGNGERQATSLCGVCIDRCGTRYLSVCVVTSVVMGMGVRACRQATVLCGICAYRCGTRGLCSYKKKIQSVTLFVKCRCRESILRLDRVESRDIKRRCCVVCVFFLVRCSFS